MQYRICYYYVRRYIATHNSKGGERMADIGQPMSEAAFYILLALLKPSHGYSMMARISELSKGRVHMGPGTLYGALTRMKKEGLIELESQDDRRKTYVITDLGKQTLYAEYERLKTMVFDAAVLEEG